MIFLLGRDTKTPKSVPRTIISMIPSIPRIFYEMHTKSMGSEIKEIWKLLVIIPNTEISAIPAMVNKNGMCGYLGRCPIVRIP